MDSRSRPWRPCRAVVVASLLFALLPATASAESVAHRTVRISAPATGSSDGVSDRPSLTADGRLVAFDTTATNLPGTGLNGALHDVLVSDHQRRMILASFGFDGSPANGASVLPAMAGDGSSVAFQSTASNLVPGDLNGVSDVFVRDLRTGLTRRVSITSTGGDPNGRSGEADLSRDGRFVVFTSDASNLVAGDTNNRSDVFVFDLGRNVTRRVSVGAGGRQGNGHSSAPSIASSGRFVSYSSRASNLVAHDSNGIQDVFRVNAVTLQTRRASVSDKERQQKLAVGRAFRQISDVSSNGRYVVFDSDDAGLVGGDLNDDTDVFVRDFAAGTTQRVTYSATGREGNNDSYFPTMSPDGRYIGYQSFARNLTPGNAGGADIFIHDRLNFGNAIATTTDGTDPVGPRPTRSCWSARRSPRADASLLSPPRLPTSSRAMTIASRTCSCGSPPSRRCGSSASPSGWSTCPSHAMCSVPTSARPTASTAR